MTTLALHLWRSLLPLTMAAITVIVLLGVITRYIFNAPLLWTDEAARVALVWMMFLGIAELFRIKYGHVGIKALGVFDRGIVGRAVSSVGTVVVVIELLVMIYGGLVLADPARQSASPALGVPMWILYAVIPLSGALSIVFILWRLAERDRGAGAEQ